MRRRELLRRIRRAARSARPRRSCHVAREGASHSVYQCGETRFTLPRHVEINEFTASAIMRLLEAELGEEWWR